MDIKHCLSGNRIAVALTAFALTAGTAAVAQQTTAPSSSTTSTQSSTTTTTTKPSKAERKAKRKERHEKMANELGLTADQKTQLKSLRDDQRKQMQAVKNDSSLSAEQKQAKMKEIHKAGMEKRDALLTPEQREKMQHIRDEHEGNEAKEGGHKWHHKKQQTTPSTTETPKS